MSLADLDAMPAGDKKDAIVNGLSRTDKIKYKEYGADVANQKAEIATARKINEQDKLQRGTGEGKRLDEQLIAKRDEYVRNIEQLSPEARVIMMQNQHTIEVLREITGNPVFPSTLQMRAKKLLPP